MISNTLAAVGPGQNSARPCSLFNLLWIRGITFRPSLIIMLHGLAYDREKAHLECCESKKRQGVGVKGNIWIKERKHSVREVMTFRFGRLEKRKDGKIKKRQSLPILHLPNFELIINSSKHSISMEDLWTECFCGFFSNLVLVTSFSSIMLYCTL